MIERERINYLLLSALGSAELVHQWWQSRNAAFDHATPEEIWQEAPDRVANYVLRAVNVGGDYF